jgi:hypothetical protein
MAGRRLRIVFSRLEIVLSRLRIIWSQPFMAGRRLQII